jgi:hypothetical protein
MEKNRMVKKTMIEEDPFFGDATEEEFEEFDKTLWGD